MLVEGAVARARHRLVYAFLTLWLGIGGTAAGGDLSVAVAANFTGPAKEIAELYRSHTGHQVDISFGASGALFTQITQGAPFEVFLSADNSRPRKAEEDGFAVPRTRFTYAVGKLVLWSPDGALVDDQGKVLRRGAFSHLAIANPSAAPYGVAALEVLTALGLDQQTAPKLVKGETIAQTFQFIASGNAELGFVSLSQLVDQDKGSRWVVPETLYAPILQDAVLLKVGEKNPVAREFLAFLQGADAARIIRHYGYGLQPGT
jgi:molybdate transport system substrate-binding protein